MMKLYVNASVETRAWPNLVDPETERTLELAPGQEIELDLPDDFEDVNLVPVPTSSRKPKTTEPTSEAGSQAVSEKEQANGR